MINFKANYINSSNILKRNINNKFEEKKASFVILDPLNETDLNVLKELSEEWEDGFDYFTKDIYNNAKEEYLKDDGFKKLETQFYALTTQKNNFESLKPWQILGLMQIYKFKDKPSFQIDYLQTKPDSCMFDQNRLYKKVGTAMLNSIKKHIPNKDIILKALDSAIEFYKTNGFEKFDSVNKYIYRIKK